MNGNGLRNVAQFLLYMKQGIVLLYMAVNGPVAGLNGGIDALLHQGGCNAIPAVRTGDTGEGVHTGMPMPVRSPQR